MSDSIVEQIVSAAVTKLNTDRPAEIPEAERARTSTLSEEGEAIVVYPGRDPSSDVGGRCGPIIEHHLELWVECWAIETDTESADRRGNAQRAWVHAALQDETFGGIANGCREVDANYAIDLGDTGLCGLPILFAVRYQHKSGDATSRS